MSAIWTTLKHRAKPNEALFRQHRVTQLQYKGFDKLCHHAARRAKMTLDVLGIKHVGPVPLPRRRRMFNFLRSPFKWKKHQELWEIRTFTRIITFEADVATTRRVLQYLYKSKYSGVGLRVRRLVFEPLDKYYKDPYLHTAEINREERLKKLRLSALKKQNWAELTQQLGDEPDTKVLRLSIGQEEAVEVQTEQPEVDFAERDVLDEDIVYDDSDSIIPMTPASLQVEAKLNAQLNDLIAAARTSAEQRGKKEEI